MNAAYTQSVARRSSVWTGGSVSDRYLVGFSFVYTGRERKRERDFYANCGTERCHGVSLREGKYPPITREKYAEPPR